MNFKARGRQQPRRDGSMNRMESSYAAHLELLKRAGEIAWYAFEPWKLRLADRTFYSPDFGVMLPDGSIEVHEVKGHWEDDARVKVKVAAEQHWMFTFKAVKAVRKRDGGGWSVVEV